jgi:hypothetical protein
MICPFLTTSYISPTGLGHMYSLVVTEISALRAWSELCIASLPKCQPYGLGTYV